jgi:nitroreductase
LKLDTLESIKKRRSIRRYLDKKVNHELICDLIEAATLAPSSGNLQNWQFIIVTNEEKRTELSIACVRQSWMQQAPVHIVICNNKSTVTRIYKNRGDLYSTVNCSLAAENIMLAATSLKLSTCIIAAFDPRTIQRILQIPDNITPESIITVGYTAEKPHPQKRKPLETKIYFEKWGNKNRDLDITPLRKQAKKIQKKAKKTKDKISDLVRSKKLVDLLKK